MPIGPSLTLVFAEHEIRIIRLELSRIAFWTKDPPGRLDSRRFSAASAGRLYREVEHLWQSAGEPRRLAPSVTLRRADAIRLVVALEDTVALYGRVRPVAHELTMLAKLRVALVPTAEADERT